MNLQDRVIYVDFIGEGIVVRDWPQGYILTHGSEGTVVRIEKGYPDTRFDSGYTIPGVADRPIVAFDINWFRRMWERKIGTSLPSHLYEDVSYNPHVLIGPKGPHHVVNTANRGEVREVEDIRKKVEVILHQMAWPDVIKHMPDGEERAFLLRYHPTKEDNLPGELPLIVRKIAAYNFLQYTFGKKGNDDLQAKYGRLMDNQLLEMERHAGKHDIIIDRSASELAPTRTQPRKEGKMAKKTVAQVDQKTGGKRKGKGYGQDDIRAALKTVKAEENPIIRLAKEKFGVSIPKGSLSDAPNPGVMKMRAGNMIRNALKTVGQFAG